MTGVSTARRRSPSAKPDDQRREAAGGVEPLHEDAEEEHRGDRRRQVRLDALQVFVEPARALDDRNPEQRDEHHHGRGDAADPHELRLRRSRPELLVEVDA